MGDGRTRNTDHLLALIVAADALLDASQLSQARAVLHALRRALEVSKRPPAGMMDLSAVDLVARNRQ